MKLRIILIENGIIAKGEKEYQNDKYRLRRNRKQNYNSSSKYYWNVKTGIRFDSK